MTDGFRYKAFISYSHTDKVAGDKLLKDLENYRVPKRLVGKTAPTGGAIPGRVGQVFRDRDELPAAEDLTAEVKKALTQSEFMIVLCSPAAAASRWVNREIIEFKKLTGERRILSVILSGEPFASDHGAADRECFPPALRFRLGDNGMLTNTPAEPLAADFRAGGDGPRRGRLKLVAGLLGVGLDTLIERDLQRKMRRVMAVTTASIFAMLGMGFLTYEAVTARQDAERHRGEAEGLIEFMLTDLRDKLEPVGRLDVLDAVGIKAVDYYDRQSLDDMPDDALGRRARAFHLLGEIDDKQGDLEGAREKFEAAYLTTATQLAQDPDNPDRIFDHSQSAYWKGYIPYHTGDNETARMAFEEYQRLAGSLTSLDANNPAWQLEAAYAAQNLGTFYLRRMETPKKALPVYLTAQTFYDSAIQMEPENTQFQQDRADLHGWLADTYASLGELGEAVDYRKLQVSFLGDIPESNEPSKDKRREEYRLKAWAAVALLQMSLGNNGETIQILENVANRANILWLDDTTNKSWLTLYVRYQLYLTDALIVDGRLEVAALELEKASNLLKNNELTKSASFKDRVDMVYFEQLLRARSAFQARQYQPALRTSKALAAALKMEATEARSSPRATLYLAYAQLIAAQASGALGNQALAQEFLQALTVELERKSGQMALRTRDVLTRAYALSGQCLKAASLASDLHQSTYANSEFTGFKECHPTLVK